MQSPLIATERLRATPVNHRPMARPDVIRTVTSGDAGYALPLGFIPMEREDQLQTSTISMMAYMQETAELLLNTVHCVFSAYFVPKLAFDRFDHSLDALNRAFMKKPEKDGSTIKWIETEPFNAAPLFYTVAGMHAALPTSQVNTDYREAYQKVFEFRCKQRSEALWEAVKDENYDLVPAFFDNEQMGIVVPSFDQDQMEGAVPLEFLGGTEAIPVKSVAHGRINDGGGTIQDRAPSAGDANFNVQDPQGNYDWTGKVWAELQEQSVQITLANIDLARETQAWARVRNAYSGIDDDDLVDLLMAGIRIPDIAQSKPILLDRRRVPFGMTQRYSTEAASLDVSATRGQAGATLKLRTPRMNTGGVVVIQAEIVPEQFWERSKDYHLLRDNDTRMPDRLLDSLDPQAVEVVENDHADVMHSDPTGVFGYAPLNHQFVRKRFNIGGKFWKPDPNMPWQQDRNRIWTSEPIDPTLSKEFWLATDLPKEVFMDTQADSFELSLACDAVISGQTYIPPRLREATGDYQSILDRVDQARITLPPAAAAADETEQAAEVVETEPAVEPGSDVSQPEGE